MCQVLVHAPGLRFGGGDGDSLLCRIVQQIISALEGLVELWNAPRGDDLDGGLESIKGEFESNLVVAFAGATMGDVLAAFLLGDFDLSASDDGAGKGCTEQVDVFV